MSILEARVGHSTRKGYTADELELKRYVERELGCNLERFALDCGRRGWRIFTTTAITHTGSEIREPGSTEQKRNPTRTIEESIFRQ
jgi:hypothetical protein